MRRHTLLAALALLALQVPAAPAHAADATGLLCGFTSISDPTVEGSQTGEIDGGPIVATDSSGLPAYVDLFCMIQTGTNDTYAEADAASCSAAGTGVVAVACTATYAVGEDEPVWMCTEVWIWDGGGHTTLFYDYTNDAWSQDANVQCSLAISAESPDGSQVDPIACPLLTVVFPPEGDVSGVWDCPPYN